MNTLLKRLPELFMVLWILTLCGCGAQTASKASPDTPLENLTAAICSEAAIHSKSDASLEETSSIDPERRKQVRLEINCDSQNRITIPDPAKITEDVVTISLQTTADLDEIYHPETGTREDSILNSRYLADLSFAGLGQDVMVSTYTTGSMTDPQCQTNNCLALFVHKNPKTEQKKNYFLVVDYGHGTYFLTETAFFLHSWTQPVDLEARDLTGDGTQELVVSHIYNKSIEVGVFRCDEQSHTLIPLFSTLDDITVTEDREIGHDYLDRTWFQGHLEDDYKVVLEFPQIQYSKTVSMIDDGGYSEKELQAGSKDRYGGINFVALWKNGKLQNKKVDSNTVFLYTLDHVDYAVGKSGKPQLELVWGICIGHRSEQIGNMHIFLQYNSAEDRLTLQRAKYVNKKQAEKEWKTFDEWDEE